MRSYSTSILGLTYIQEGCVCINNRYSIIAKQNRSHGSLNIHYSPNYHHKIGSTGIGTMLMGGRLTALVCYAPSRI